MLAVARVVGDKSAWESYQPFIDTTGGNPVKIVTFSEMVSDIDEGLGTTLASTEVGRLLQMFRAAGFDIQDK